MAFELLHSIGFTELSDEELLAKYIKTNNQHWISQLFGRYVQLIYGVCLRYTPDVREAEDMTMEIYQKVAQKANKHKIGQFRSWVYVLSKNHCLEQIRKMTGKRTDSFDPAFMQLRTEFHPIDEQIDHQMQESRYLLVEDCLKQLSSLQQTSIRLFYYQNKSYVEIAQQIEDEVSQVRSYLQNGRRNIKKCVERKSK